MRGTKVIAWTDRTRWLANKAIELQTVTEETARREWDEIRQGLRPDPRVNPEEYE